ncbi:11802_t:CDS:2 [Funneliformis geosporum]|nr:11802_t:CDS:2 [Funneliformis geosporum]
MASTAAGVAIGHSIGHGITGLFSGSGSAETPEPQQQYTPQTQNEQPQYQAFQNDNYGEASCENDAKALTKCLELNNHNIGLCQYYLENLKACQQMASQL